MQTRPVTNNVAKGMYCLKTSKASHSEESSIFKINGAENTAIKAFSEKKENINLDKDNLKLDIYNKEEGIKILKMIGICAAVTGVLGGIIGMCGTFVAIGGITAALILSGDYAFRIISQHLKIRKLDKYFNKLNNEQKKEINKKIKNDRDYACKNIEKYIKTAKEMISENRLKKLRPFLKSKKT